MSSYLALLVAAYVALSSLEGPLPATNMTEWENFKVQHGKSYESGEVETLRRLIYSYNKQQIAKLQGSVRFELGLNHLSDRTEAEMKQLNGLRIPKHQQTGLSDLPENSPESQKFLDGILNDDTFEVPDEVDWRKVAGRVTRVKDQGSTCGSCWAFSTTGVLEGQEVLRAKNGNKTLELSEQNLIDCDKTDAGCQGGLPMNAMNFIKKEGGIDGEQAYPYRGSEGRCRFQKEKVVFEDSGAAILPEGDEDRLKKVVAKYGPVSVGIDASIFTFMQYKKGVYSSDDCRSGRDNLDHAVLVVGYGSDKTEGDYWIVKNSWGESWGEDGYIRMARNANNMCGIATLASIATF